MRTVLVIRDSSNAEWDYHLPESYAIAEYQAGRLSEVQVYGVGQWNFYDPAGRHLTHRKGMKIPISTPICRRPAQCIAPGFGPHNCTLCNPYHMCLNGCNRPIAKRAGSKFCSTRCRMQYHARRRAEHARLGRQQEEGPKS